jgi:EAL domain-containing protein (putative c-di-GMP-specific phosphodiesterase class I)
MVKNLVQMCNDLKINVIAEMVEEEQQAELLRNLGVGYAQGYLFAKPSPKPEYNNDKATAP